MTRRAKWGLAALSAVLAYTVGGFFVLPAVLKDQLEKRLPPILHRDIAIDTIRFNPFTLTLHITGFRATEPTGAELASFRELLVNLQASSLFQRSLNFKEVTLARPSLKVMLLKEGGTNFDTIGKNEQAEVSPAPASDTPTKPLSIRIEHLAITDGRVAFEDHARAAPYRTLIAPIAIQVTNFTTEPDARNPHSFTAHMDPDTSLIWSGDFSLRPLKSSGTLSLEGVHINGLAPYYLDRFKGEIRDGVIAMRAAYRLDTSQSPLAFEVRDGEFTLTNFVVADPESKEVRTSLPRLHLQGMRLDLANKQVEIQSLSSADGTFSAVRDKEGIITFQKMVAAPPENETGLTPTQETAPEPTGTPFPWHTTLHGARLDNFSLSFTDQLPSRPAQLTVDQISVALKEITYPEPNSFSADLSMRWNQQGTVGISGRVTHTPISADLDATIKDFSLTPFQPYLEDKLHVVLASAGVEARGHFSYGRTTADVGSATPLARYQGELALLRLLAKDSRSAELLAKWDALRFTGIDAQVTPTRIALEQIHLKNFVAQGTIENNGTLNLASLVRPSAGPVGAARETPTERNGKPAGSLSVSVKNLVIENAGVSLLDRSIQPPLSTGITHLTGRIRNFAVPGPSKMTIALSAKADNRAPLKISGQVEPNGKDSLLDLLLALNGYDVPAFTGYSAKYVGYPIQKGKLSLDLKYAIADRKLTGDNTVLVDQLTLGEKTDSPEATSLPVKLALAILTDRKGQIHLDVPVGGSLDDPEFTLGRVILRAVINILEKVATSPFALLGAVVGGGGEELKDIAFEPGRATLAEAETAKLGKLAKALAERPTLNLEVEASIDPNEDRPALAKDKLMRILKQKKLQATGSKAQTQINVDDIPLEQPEYETMVRALHASLLAVLATTQADKDVPLEELPPPPAPPSGFWGFLRKLNPFAAEEPQPARPAPRASADDGTQKTAVPAELPFAEVEQAILDREPVTEEELARLRKDRAQAVQAYLVEQGQLSQERVFTASTSDQQAPPSTHATLKLN